MPSSSQTSTAVTRGGRGGTGASTAPSGLRQRRPARSAGAGGRSLQQSVVNFYTDDSPGLKVQPVYVIVMSLGFILFVTVLHIVGKIRG